MQTQAQTLKTAVVDIQGVEMSVPETGEGRSVLVLHGAEGPNAGMTYVDTLAADHRVLLPTHPGFALSARPAHVKTIDDISYMYLDLIDSLGEETIDLIGFSMGGWIACEIATKLRDRIDKLVLVDTLGVKFAGRLERDIADLHAMNPDEVASRLWHNPQNHIEDYAALSREERESIASTREAVTRFGWEPYMHSPSLKHRLHRIDAETLVVWGSSDGVVSESYGRQIAKLIPNASFAMIDDAGHRPHIEQPEAFSRLVSDFLAN